MKPIGSSRKIRTNCEKGKQLFISEETLREIRSSCFRLHGQLFLIEHFSLFPTPGYPLVFNKSKIPIILYRNFDSLDSHCISIDFAYNDQKDELFTYGCAPRCDKKTFFSTVKQVRTVYHTRSSYYEYTPEVHNYLLNSSIFNFRIPLQSNIDKTCSKHKYFVFLMKHQVLHFISPVKTTFGYFYATPPLKELYLPNTHFNSKDSFFKFETTVNHLNDDCIVDNNTSEVLLERYRNNFKRFFEENSEKVVLCPVKYLSVQQQYSNMVKSLKNFFDGLE